MNLTQHAKERLEQRNISGDVLGIILKNGSITHASGGAMKIFLGNKEAGKMISDLKNTIKLIERAKGGALIVTPEDLITVYRVS